MEQMTRVQQNTLRKIVEAAIELMSEKGFHRVSVQEVGKKAGICEKTVFRYFATKSPCWMKSSGTGNMPAN